MTTSDAQTTRPHRIGMLAIVNEESLNTTPYTSMTSPIASWSRSPKPATRVACW